ncbi:MAG: hypothetical protein HC780_22840 [Leptolyngbyaceae cyanobacterium CSU_1_3]|nr:hypothetical protein [Leptolyngbyaceae cyanobacterium CSU_1_3]
MPRSSWFNVFRSLGLNFWLLLPVLGLLGWAGSGLMMDWMLHQSSPTDKMLVVNTQGRPATVLTIQVAIVPQQGISRVKIRTTRSMLRGLEYELPTIDPRQIEWVISQEMGVPLTQIRRVIQYI